MKPVKLQCQGYLTSFPQSLGTLPPHYFQAQDTPSYYRLIMVILPAGGGGAVKIFHIHQLPPTSFSRRGRIDFNGDLPRGDRRRRSTERRSFRVCSALTFLLRKTQENSRMVISSNFSQGANWTRWKWLQGDIQAAQWNKATNHVEPDTPGVGASRPFSCFNTMYTGVCHRPLGESHRKTDPHSSKPQGFMSWRLSVVRSSNIPTVYLLSFPTGMNPSLTGFAV